MLIEGQGVPAPSYTEAALLLQRASDSIPQAQHLLAVMHEYGYGVEQSFDAAARLYRRAVEQQHVESMYHLALLYAYGRGVPQDFLRARPLLDAAASANHAPSIYYIGALFISSFVYQQWVVAKVTHHCSLRPVQDARIRLRGKLRAGSQLVRAGSSAAGPASERQGLLGNAGAAAPAG